MRRIAIGSAGTGNGFSLVKKFHNWKSKGFASQIITLDCLPRDWVASSRFSDQHFQVPKVSDSGYLDRLCEILRAENVDTYYSFIDQECLLVSSCREIRGLNGIRLIPAISKNGLVHLASKITQHKFMKDLGLPVEHYLPESWINFPDDYRVVKKDASGSGSKGVCFVTIGDLKRTDYANHGKYGVDWVLSEALPGDEYTTDVVKTKTGIRTMSRRRVEVKAGVVTKAEVFYSDDLQRLGVLLATSGVMPEVFNFQTKKTSNSGLHTIFDLNPRVGAGSSVSGVNGLDPYEALVRDCFEVEYDPEINVVDSRVVLRVLEDLI